MTATAQISKLAELRAKTDRDLVWLIGNALGLLMAATRSDSAEQLHGRAQEIYADTLMLLPKVEDVNERQRLEERVEQLRNSLERRLEGERLVRDVGFFAKVDCYAHHSP